MIDQFNFIKYPRASVDDLPIIRKQPKLLIIHAGTNAAVTFTSGDIINQLFQLKAFIQENLPDAKITISKPTLTSDNGNVGLTARQFQSNNQEN